MNNFNFQTEQPESGQFVIVWRDNRLRINASTFKWVDGELKELDSYDVIQQRHKLILPDSEMILGYLT